MSSSTAKLERPRQVTFWGWMAVAAGVIVLLTSFEAYLNIGSLDTRERITDLLAEPPWSGTGLGVADLREMMRVATVVAGVASVAVIPLAVFSLRRDRGARIGLSVAAVPVLVTGLPFGWLSSAIVAAAAISLWLQPARDWFAGREPAPTPTSTPTSAKALGAGGWGGAPPSTGPGATSPDEAARSGATTAQHEWQPPFEAERLTPARRDRPLALVRAVLLTAVFSGGVLVTSIMVWIAVAAEPDLMLDEARKQDPSLFEQGLNEAQLMAGVYMVLAGFILWCLGAIVLAVLTWRGQDWARICLIISASAAALTAGMGALAQPVLLIAALAGVITVAQLVRPEVSDWFRRR